MTENVLSNEEKNNLLILAMKADGLNNKLVADGILGEQAVIAVRIFIEHQIKIMSTRMSESVPPDRITVEVLKAIIPDVHLDHLLIFIGKIQAYFVEHSIAP